MVDVLRYVVFGVFVYFSGIALGAWALRTRRIRPFSPLARLVSRAGDPLLSPVEQWLVRRGGNPQNAGWLLVGLSVGGGILVLSLAGWLSTQALFFGAALKGGPRQLFRLAVYYAGQVVLLSILVRVIGSWVGVGRYNRFMRIAYRLSDWIVNPIRRVLPPAGIFDFSPFVAWILVRIALSWILAVI